jgi:hypothetical protein
MIVSGRAEMRPDQAAESLSQLRLRYRLGGMVADTYASAGFTASSFWAASALVRDMS